MTKEISFIIPAFNESRHIKSCLSSIINESSQADLNIQVIVIDNGSTDNTAEIARIFPVELYSIARSSVSFARNHGASRAKYRVLAFIDGDVAITTDWIKCISDNYNNFINNPLFITGHQCSVPQSGSWIEQYWFKNIEDQLLGGANIITTKDAFALLKGFDETLKTGEDYDFCLRAIDLKIKYQTNPAFKAIHLGFPHTLTAFIKREYWHGEGDFKSFDRFIQSPVAIIAIIYLALIIIFILNLIFENWINAVFTFLAILILNTIITIKRFYRTNIRTIAVNSFLNFMYFIARIGSLYRAIKNKRLRY